MLLCVLCLFAAVPAGPEVPAALLPIGSFFAADSSQTPISQGADNLLLSALEDTVVITAAMLQVKSRTAVKVV